MDDTPVYTLDWRATFLEVAGARPDPAYPLDGRSLSGHLFRGEKAPCRDLFWRLKGQRALRRGSLTYVRGTDGLDHLYDLQWDAREQADVGARQAGELSLMRAAWEAVDATLLPYPT